MNKRLNVLLAFAAVLLFFNVLNWAGIFRNGKDTRMDNALVKLKIMQQGPAEKQYAAVSRGIFSGVSDDSPPVERTSKIEVPKQIKQWPRFKISGIAENGGKKIVFFSGAEFSGAVSEGSDFDGSYKVDEITGTKVKITDTINNESKVYNLEGK